MVMSVQIKGFLGVLTDSSPALSGSLGLLCSAHTDKYAAHSCLIYSTLIPGASLTYSASSSEQYCTLMLCRHCHLFCHYIACLVDTALLCKSCKMYSPTLLSLARLGETQGGGHQG